MKVGVLLISLAAGTAAAVVVTQLWCKSCGGGCAQIENGLSQFMNNAWTHLDSSCFFLFLFSICLCSHSAVTVWQTG